ncbi:hypothetical protein Peur_019840 [Populus x canadensis]
MAIPHGGFPFEEDRIKPSTGTICNFFSAQNWTQRKLRHHQAQRKWMEPCRGQYLLVVLSFSSCLHSRMVSREERNFVWGPLLPMLSVLDSSIFQIRCSSTPRPKPPLKLTFLSFTGSVA